MTNEVERNKALIRAHYEATVNHFDPALIEEQVAEDVFDHAAGTRLGPDRVKQHIQALKTVFPDLQSRLRTSSRKATKLPSGRAGGGRTARNSEGSRLRASGSSL